MFRTVGDQPSLFESVLPQELLRLSEKLARVDAMLDDPAFFAPLVPFFDPRIGASAGSHEHLVLSPADIFSRRPNTHTQRTDNSRTARSTLDSQPT